MSGSILVSGKGHAESEEGRVLRGDVPGVSPSPIIHRSSPSWRLLITAPQPGSLNMAIDEAIASAVAEGRVPPTLRLYRWNPPCLSLGYFQSATETVDLQRCRELGVDCVRRPTGGRAVLHDDELTYSLAAPESHPLVSGDVTESYRKISAAVLAGLRHLGIAAETAPPAPGQSRPSAPTSAVCFHVPSDYELTVEGRKIVGSAQMRTRGVVLQHGSFLLSTDPGKLFWLLKLPPEQTREALIESFRQRVTSAQEVLGRPVSFAEAAKAMTEGFAAALRVELAEGALTSEEISQAERLQAEKYGSPNWNYRR